MNFLDATTIIKAGGYAAIFAILFAETGALIGFFLPGDSLLFTAGFLASVGYLHIIVLIVVAFSGAVLGDTFGYYLGKKYGHKIFKKQDSLFFHIDHIARTEKFYKKHGGKTIIFARFLPVIRTAAPIMAGVGKMKYATFVTYNILGGALWAGGLSLIGFYLGKVIPNPDRYIFPIIVGIFVISTLPAIIAVLQGKESRAKIIIMVKSFFSKGLN